MTSRTPVQIVVGFLDALALAELDTAMSWVADDIEYVNVSTPTLRGKKKVAKIFGMLTGGRVGFDYRMINIASEDTVVLTERIDELRVGRLRVQFWVCGRFEVRDGHIAVWRDYFDYLDCTKGFLIGVAALAVPRLQPPLRAVTV